MLLATFIDSSGALLTVVTPLITVPLTAMIFFVRSLRDQQRTSQSALAGRIDSVEEAVDHVRRTTFEFYRDFAGKEEWLRECMIARRSLEQLSATTVRLETHLQIVLARQNGCGRSNGSPKPGSTSNVRGVEERSP